MKLIYKILNPIRHVYWRLFQPKTYGVKAIIQHPADETKVLLIRHSYGNTKEWNFPGGRFFPHKEQAKHATIREVKEELGVNLINPVYIGEYFTDYEGKRDTVSIFCSSTNSTDFTPNSEVSEVQWVHIEDIIDNKNHYRVVRKSASYLCEYLKKRA